jgi:hypothetical protein
MADCFPTPAYDESWKACTGLALRIEKRNRTTVGELTSCSDLAFLLLPHIGRVWLRKMANLPINCKRKAPGSGRAGRWLLAPNAMIWTNS